MPKTFFKSVLVLSMLVGISTACKKKAEEEDSLNYQIPRVTDPVGVVRGASVNASSSGLKLIDSTSLTACTGAGNCTNTNAQQMFNMGSTFVGIGASADVYTCIAQALVNGSDLGTDGAATVLTDSSGFKIRMTATTSGSSLATYSIQVCDTGASNNGQYTSGTLGADGTTSIKLKVDSTRWATMTGTDQIYINLSGNYTDGIWNSKQLTFEAQDSGNITDYVITQGSDNLTIQASGNSASGWQAYGKFKMLGSTVQDYAFDEGSAITPGGPLSSWDSNGNTGGSAYRSEVQSGQLIAVPTTFSGSFSASENWNCQAGGEKAVSFEAISEKSAQAMINCLQ